MRSFSAGLSTAALATFLTGGTALAADADAFATRLKDAMAAQSIAMTYESARSEGDDVVLVGVKFGTGADISDAGDLTFENVQGSTEQGWTAERLPVEDVTGTDTSQDGGEPVTYAFRDMSVENIRIAGTAPSEPLPQFLQASPLFFESASIGSIAFESGENEVFTIENAVTTNEIGDDGTYAGDFKVESFDIDVPETSVDGSAETIRALGYESLTGSMDGRIEWALEEGTLALTPLSFDVDEVGSFDMSFALGGYTLSLVQSLQQMSEQMEQNPENSQGAGMAMMGILGQMNIRNIALQFEDDSLTRRLVDYYAEQMNQSPENVVDLAVQIVQGSINQIGDEAFRTQLTDAVRTFLEDPALIRIASEPAQPIAVMQIVGAAMGAPQSIPSVLQLEVEANGEGSGGSGGTTTPDEPGAPTGQ
ncbi:hypothetical protein U0C82_11955 [Fulvimarina sp. 2208YS6-2-32]|uniref:DUF945 domain-containing protein n=1 Tax=Fulvimarina uroteuthidis TaxID=3098149 RepID=A0ABU5I551_9HYPH|nr:hypothetical protein [Fulvimarina sp. 2208YS6-2-32]MDY8109853.1 hypothetical protein [Fulvimarina sp. 2208YS6-2-32]